MRSMGSAFTHALSSVGNDSDEKEHLSSDDDVVKQKKHVLRNLAEADVEQPSVGWEDLLRLQGHRFLLVR